MRASLKDIASMLGATAPADAETVVVTGVSIDTRRLEPGDLFVALDGVNARGIEFVADAGKKGASAAIVPEAVDSALPQLVVADPLQSLQALGANWRQRFSPTVIGITGSNGKTTMRSLVAACLGEHCLATEGNLNNHIGVPLMLTRLAEDHRFAVIEMGANHAGEIAQLAAWVNPDIGIVTNAGPAHLEGFGSLDGVAAAKGELFVQLAASDTAIVNADDVYAPQWREMALPARIATFGRAADADVRYENLRSNTDGSIRFDLLADGERVPVTLQLRGAHNAQNACGAVAVALAAGRSLAQCVEALAGVAPEPGRQRVHQLADGARLFDDSYNANPASMLAAAQALVADTEHAWMAIGDMGELGDGRLQMHRETGRQLREAGIERLFTLGELAAEAADGFGAGAEHFTSPQAMLARLSDELHEDVSLLVKGSRSMRMERIVTGLLERAGS